MEGKLENILRKIKRKTQHTKTYAMEQKYTKRMFKVINIYTNTQRTQINLTL
jgi:hypothetical protein